MSLPTGGSISYGYSGGNNGLDCPTPGTGSWVVPTLTRTVKDNNGHTDTWTYVNSNNTENSSIFTVTVQDPSNNYMVYTFQRMSFFCGAYQTERQVYQGSVNSQHLIDTEITCYNGNFTSCPTAPNAFTKVTQTDVYSYTGCSSSPSLVETMVDSYGNTSEVKKYGFGASMPPTGTPVSDTTISHDGVNGVSCGTLSGYVYDRPCVVQTVNSGTLASKGQNTYNAAGHPIQTSKWVTGTTYLTSSATYNANGTVSSTTDVNMAVTNDYYNGPGGCNGLLLTSTQLPVNNLSTAQAWNCSGGVLISTTDANGQSTAYGYVTQSGIAEPY